MTTATDNPVEVGIHIFERAGLGKAPFRFIGCNEKWYVTAGGAHRQPGGSCDYCGNGILWEFWLRAADGKQFKVGSSCIDKSEDRGLIRAYKSSPAMRAKAKAKRQAKDQQVTAQLDAIIATAADRLAAFPHPAGYTHLTAFDYATFMRQRAGATGRARAVKLLSELL